MLIDFPLQGRLAKPRLKGLTMVIDKGLGLVSTKELLEISAPFIDYIKLGFGTSALYNEQVLRKKIALVRSYGVDIYPGGTFFEVACLQNKVKEYFKYVTNMGFTAVEISDGTIPLEPGRRRQAISAAKESNLKVITEIGKKSSEDAPTSEEMLELLQEDLASTTNLVIVEGRESGKGIGVYDNNGELRKEVFAELLSIARKSDKIMWEAPLKNQQQELIMSFGPNVNLGNIAPNEILSLEALRVGLRGDTLRATLKAKEI